jgi:hypothetical protein
MPKFTTLETFVLKAILVDMQTFCTNTYSKLFYLNPRCNCVFTFLVDQPDNYSLTADLN